MDVLGLVLERAAAAPDAPAAKDPNVALSFGELAAEVEEMAGGLASNGVAEGDRVILEIENSVAFLVSALACMWTGAIFVPLSKDDPPARLAGLVEDCDPVLVLSDRAETLGHPSGPGATGPGATGTDATGPRSVSQSDHGEATPSGMSLEDAHGGRPVVSPGSFAGQGHQAPQRATGADRPAYCIYTSGTTGKAKGVLVAHRGFAAGVTEASRLLGLGPHTRALCVSPFHFDGSYSTLFSVPAAGGFLAIPRRESLMFPRIFFKSLREEQINHTSCAPSYLRLLLSSKQMSELAGGPLRTLALGGEACVAAEVEQLWTAAPDLRVFNRYGPTEAVIAVTTYELHEESVHPGSPVPIGPPHEGVSFVLVGDDQAVIDTPGEVGELYIGGVQLMSRYWREPELTSAVMRPDIVEGEVLYRTGDLALRDTAGVYTCLGRADSVIKRSGVRISTVELAEAVRQAAGVNVAHCASYDNDGQLGIACFAVSAVPLDTADIRAGVFDRLPYTMVPDVIEVTARLPLTSNGKIDEPRLLADAGLRTWRSVGS